MNIMKAQSLIPLAATAALITSAAASVTIDYVSVGHAGNAADSTGYGAVAYAYQIGKYEVTNAQYGAFLNAVDPDGANANGVYNSNMGSNARGGITYTAGAASGAKYTIRTSMGDKPVNYVSWYDAARFTNWLGNGQGSGSTETGSYTLNGNTGIITKNVGATVYLPSEDEWYKAAYYDPTAGAGGGDNYWLHATQSDTAPTVGSANFSTGAISNPGANVANYNIGADWNDLDGNVTTVGSAAANNYFGTFDQAGNVREWNDAVISGSSRGLRGGSFNSNEDDLRSSTRNNNDPSNETISFGFRVASVPEPTSLLLTMLAGGVMLARRKR
jgi:formylglycine-generating enzyme required for sulfatase activity